MIFKTPEDVQVVELQELVLADVVSSAGATRQRRRLQVLLEEEREEEARVVFFVRIGQRVQHDQELRVLVHSLSLSPRLRLSSRRSPSSPRDTDSVFAILR